MQNIRDITARQDVVRRRTQFDGDPESFYSQWIDQEELLGAQILLARRRMENIEVPEKMIELAVRLALEVDAQGHRADITMVKAARVLTALLEKSCVEREEILEAAHLVLPHRMGKNPLEKDGVNSKLFDEAVARVLSDGRTPASAEGMDRPAEDLRAVHEAEEIQVPGAAAAGSILFDFLKKKAKRSSLSRKT
jgi:magnesium chelatase subunit I